MAGNRGNIRENVDPNSDEIIRAPPVEELKDTVLESLNQLNKSHTGGDNMRNASDHQCRVKTSGSEKKENEDRYDLSSKKRVTKKFLEVSRCSRANQRQRNVQKSVLHVPSCFFNLLIRPIAVFPPFSLPSLLSITRFYILFEQTLNIMESFALSPG